EKAKQKMIAAPVSETKAPEPKAAQIAKVPAPASLPGSRKAEANPQAFPSAQIKNPDAGGQIQEKTMPTEQARIAQSEVRDASAIPSTSSAPKPAAENTVRESSAGTVAAPPVAAVPAAPVPAGVATRADTALLTTQARLDRGAQTAARAPASAAATMGNARNADAAPETLRKSGQLGVADTVAAYSAAQTWLAKIEALLREGKIEEAETNLAEFKKRFPNYVTPDWIRDEIGKQRAAINFEANK
ncbi:MAG: hypothetical protein WCE43_01465, partial [Burkholderiales bacterium]